MSNITTNVEREKQIEALILDRILGQTTPEACGRDIVILANACPPPLHRWFTVPQHQVIAVGLDDALAGRISTTPDAILDRMSQTSHSHALDIRQGKSVRAWQACEYADSAFANVDGYTGIADLHERALGFVGVRDLAQNVKLLRNAGARRQIIAGLRDAAAEVAASDLRDGPYEAVQRHQDRILALIGGSTEQNIGDCLYEALRAGESFAALRDQGQAPRASWGIPALDALVPMRPGGLYVLAAAPKAGKTSLALQAASAVARDGGQGAVSICSLEMSGSELAMIVAGRQLGIAPAAIRERSPNITAQQWNRLEDLAATWRGSASVLVRDNSKTTPEGFAAWLSQRRNASPRMSLAVLDYLQILDRSNPRQTEYEFLTAATRQLKRTAIGLKLPILCLSQMNRAGRAQVKDRAGKILGDPEPTLADLRGSGSIEQDADAVVFLHKLGAPDPRAESILVRATVAANRAGPEGFVDLWFNRRQQIFEEARAVGSDVAEIKKRQARAAAAPSASEERF